MDAKTLNARIEKASKREKKWRQEAQEVIDTYRSQQKDRGSQFNILWANTETMRPALFSSLPKPDIRRRYRDQDPISRIVSEVLERAQSYVIEKDFKKVGKRVTTDYLLPGRAVSRVRYVPTLVRGEAVPVEGELLDDQGNRIGPEFYNDENLALPENVQIIDGVPFELAPEELVMEDIDYEHVNWDDYRESPAKCWDDVTWIAFRHYMTKAEAKESFPGFWKDISYGQKEEDDEKEVVREDVAEIWEVWNKEDRKVYWVAKDFDKILKKQNDPLELTGFFPIPEPVYAVDTNGDRVPVPLYSLYKDQADELNDITQRIGALIKAIRAKGFYAAAEKESFDAIEKEDDSILIPYPDSWAAFAEKGGLDGAISWFPIEQFGKTLSHLYQKRQELLDTIYQITGLSDLQRGSTDPRETAKAQSLKGQFGDRRLIPIQMEVQEHFRDLIRLGTEVMCNHFQLENLFLMAGIDPVKELSGFIDPEDGDALEETLDDIEKVIRNDTLRSFRIDIETDSTIAADEQQDKQDVTELLGSLSQFLPIAAQFGQITGDQEVTKQILLFSMRKFKAGRGMEDIIESMQTQPQLPPEIQQQVEQMEQQIQQLSQENQNLKLDKELKAAETEAKIQATAEKTESEIDRKDALAEAEIQTKTAETEAKIQREDEKAELEMELDKKESDAQRQAV